MAPDRNVQHILIGQNQADVFVTTQGHCASLHVVRGAADAITIGELNALIEALHTAKKQLQAFQLARINAGHAALLHAA
jgi:hypothetical protein